MNCFYKLNQRVLIVAINLCILFALISLTKAKNQNAGSLDKISLNGKWYVDQSGRVVMFRGINAVQKSYPWLPYFGHVNLTNETQLDYLQKWGYNAIRLGVMWSGLIPEKNTIDQTYLNEIINITNRLASYGIYVIIDLHQDMLSSKFNSYDGAPLWVLNELPNIKHEFPWPFKNGSSLGFQSYLTAQNSFSFQCLYDNIGNFETYFRQYWEVVASVFSKFSSVLAYELINEPWAGDIYDLPIVALPGVSGRYNLMPLYDRTYSLIRKHDPNTIVFYEPVTWGIMSTKSYLGTGFDHPPGFDSKRTALSWHFYCWLYNIDINPLVNGSIPEFAKSFCDDWQLKDYFTVVEQDLARFGGAASFMTEFGDCSFFVKNSTDHHKQNTFECENILNAADKHFQSWTYWDSNFYFDDTYEVNEQLVNVFSRVYPMYTNGIPGSLYYNSTTGEFNYAYLLNEIDSLARASLPTEIFVPPHVYPSGFNVSVSENLKWSFNKDNNRVLVYLSDGVLNKFVQNGNFRANDIGQVSIRSA